ncbi:ATP-binding protein [Micrococcus terreus]|uniref:sensor histidine kinase n=1 Tax=Micrococcus terreus TaxID=574650 RepID=UPI003D705A14
MNPTRERGRLRRSMRLRLLLLQLAIVLFSVLAVALVVLRFEDVRTRELAFEQVHTVAEEMAQNRDVVRWINEPEAAEHIQPIARLAQRAAGVAFVVVADRDGLRVAHPDPEMIGRPVSSDHGPVRGGETFRGTEEGPLGVTFRSKVPVWDGDQVVGTVSVGVQQSEIRGDLLAVVLGFAPWVLGAAALGTAAAALAARYVRKRIYGAEPEQMAALHQSREALLHSVGDGVVGVDERGVVTLLNDEARRLLDLPSDVTAEGRPAREVFEGDVGAMLAGAGGMFGTTGAPDSPDSPESPDSTDSTTLLLAGERILVARLRPALIDGRPAGRTLTLQDRTELENTVRELEGQRSLAETLRAQTHEFSNRLHVISGLLSLGEADEAQQYVRSLTGTRSTAGPVDLEDPSLTALVGAQTAAAREAGVGLSVAEDSHVSAGWRSDEDTLTVVANLLTNAIEAAGDGGQVQLHVDAGAGDTTVRVDDSGPGVDPAVAREVFRWGASTKQDADGRSDAIPAGGRGIGLALVDRIVRRRLGQVDVETSPLGGARFTAAWPGRPERGE